MKSDCSAWITALALTYLALPAAALEIDLPGERQLEFHGWYEVRLRLVGDDFPSNGVTLSQFRHVLNVETELQLFPDGVGPLDLVLAYARFEVLYECIYTRACGLAPGADSYGGKGGREPESLPHNVRTGVNGASFVGGTRLRRRTETEQLAPVHELLNPGRRPRDPINPSGVSQNPNPAAGFANSHARSRLDSPTDQFAGFAIHARGASFTGSEFYANYVLQARFQVGEENFLDLVKRLNPRFLLSEGDRGEVRLLNTRIGRALSAGRDRRDPDLVGWIARRDSLVLPDASDPDTVKLDYFMFDPDVQRTLAFPEIPAGAERNLLATRPDPSVFAAVANETTPELFTTTFGAHTTSSFGSIPYRATIGSPVRPLGFFAGGDAANLINNNAPGVVQGVKLVDITTLPPGINAAAVARGALPLFVGPDGLLNTADDLPETRARTASGITVSEEIPPSVFSRTQEEGGEVLPVFLSVGFINGTLDERPGLGTTGKPLILFAVGNPALFLPVGCRLLGGTLDSDGSCRDAEGGSLDRARVAEVGCQTTTGGTGVSGINAQGDCIQLNALFGATVQSRGVHFGVVPALSDPTYRPSGADREPFDLTDYKVFATARILPPARPRAPGNTIAFQSPGTAYQLRTSHHLISNLDLDFDVQELEWGHGAGDDEHELREAYLELESLGSQLFARLGKQILVWGKTELFQGVNRFNPSDLSGGIGGGGLEDSRIAQWGLDVVLAPSWAMRLGPLRDLRLEGAVLFDDFEPTDLGVCGEAGTPIAVCGELLGAYGHGLLGVGLIGERRPDEERSGPSRFDYGVRLEGHWRRFAFSVSDFWGWDDAPLQEVAFEYSRRVDPETGAPVNAQGPLSCKVRTRDGVAVGPDGDPATTYDNGIPSIGNCLLFEAPTGADAPQPLRARDKIAANHSVNQTLFHTVCSFTFDPDSGYCALDQLNEPTSFSSLAGLLSGVPLTGIVFEGVETIRVAGQPPTTNSLLAPGVSINRAADSFVRAITPPGQDPIPTFDTSLDLPPEQQALIGCGPAFVSPCGLGDINPSTAGGRQPGFASHPAFKALVGVTEGEPTGGVDLMNADGGVLTQESSLLKALQAGALIGTRRDPASGLRFESGVTVGGENSVAAARLGLDPMSLAALSLEERAARIRAATGQGSEGALPASDAWIEPFPWKVDQAALREGLVLFKVADQTKRDPRCDPARSGRARDITGEPVFTESEATYCTHRSRAWASDPNTLVFNDGTDPTNPENEFLVPFDGDESDLYNADGSRSQKLLDWVDRLLDVSEQCSALFKLNGTSPDQTVAGTFFDRGCTKLEGISANYERFVTGVSLIGGDRSFDPPETLAEIRKMLDGGFADDSFGDPLSGPDGIVVKNKRVFAVETSTGRRTSPENDVHAIVFVNPGDRLKTSDVLLPTLDLDGDGRPDGRRDFTLSDLTMNEFFAALNPETICAGVTGRCYAQVGSHAVTVGRNGQLPLDVPEGTALPVAIHANLPVLDGKPVPPLFARPLVNMLELYEKRPMEFARFWAGERVAITNLDSEGRPLPLDDPNRIRLKFDRAATGGPLTVDFDTMEVRAVANVINGLKDIADNIDGNPRQIQALDQDLDGVYDGLDDGSPGPISDDAILCGSGLPGDVLQAAIQVELYSEAEEQAFADAFPRGLPRRSPVNCGGTNAALGGTGQTLPFLRAGGDGRYGRRDFQWHAGREIVLRYEKRNVLGLGLDFAHDPSRTSWNMELTWENDLHIGDTNAFDGLSNTDQYVLTVSVDRPTFFRFLNPSRTFFLNFQFFVRYLTDYNGGRDDRDGNFGFAEGPWSGQATLTFFTGYFQDRLTPRTALIWDPTSSSYGVAWGLGYRFRNNLTTDVRVSHFFGHPESIRRSFFPSSLYGDSRLYGESGRGFGGVFNEDSAGLSLRYSW